ncbi:unnamed protein product [Merluccius merluccius]
MNVFRCFTAKHSSDWLNQQLVCSVARNQYERMGSDVTMRCGSLGDEASVSWKVNGTDVRAGHRLDGPRLLLPRVDLSHNGLYSCFQNPRGERRDTISLRIGSKHRSTTRYVARYTLRST